MFLLDRSRLAQYQRCPRSYYWQYAYKGLGVSPQHRALPLAFGGATHLGLERLLRCEGIEQSVSTALHDFELQARGRGLELQENEDSYAVYREQSALMEALLRSWFIVRYPSFNEEYEVLELEREEEWRAASDITFMARADGVLRNRADGGLYILSFKTTKQYSVRTPKEARTDIQGMSELVAVEERLGERVQGIQMEYLVKGRRDEWPKGSGIYQTSSPLIRPWVNADGRYAHSWDWEDMDGRHTLGSKYRKVAIYEQVPIAQWIERLASGTVQPEAGTCLDHFIVSPLPYNRNRDEIESWKRQSLRQAQELSDKGTEVEGERVNGDFVEALDNNFVQHRHSCLYPTQCPCYDICFGSSGPDPENSGKYSWREPHHVGEQEQQEEQ